ncbi:MAG TPA: PQQ-dependent sugar dehydrogenase [Candidatus Eremiobacteraceae bacterium]|nr:PQQ-dependent sugar dehydrogenase [Candidatus Eremiobacteraceae bacterium]
MASETTRSSHRFPAFLALALGLGCAAAIAACGGSGSSLPSGNPPQQSPTPATSTSPAASGTPVAFLSLPAGFHATYVSKNVPGARFMAVAPNGDLLVSETQAGAVVIIPPGSSPDAQPRTFVSGLTLPHGLVFSGSTLYVATWSGVLRYAYPSTTATTLFSNMPQGGDHNYRSLAVAGDGSVYVSSGSDCNICNESDARFATVLHYANGDATGSIYASGLRNASGLAFDNQGRLWAVVNQRDDIGPSQAVTDNLPPDELDQVPAGGNFGWPRCYPDPNAADRLPNPEYASANCSGQVPAALDFQAHSAPLGIVFYYASQFPAQYRGGAFVAFHGSWDRSVATGDKVVYVTFSAGRPVSYQDFITGWLQSGNYVGRPVGLALAADGSLYVGDDRLGAIYRISYGP